MRIGLDLDGTLLDSRARHLAALRQSACAVGVALAEEDILTYWLLKTDGSNGLTALRRLGIPEASKIHQEWVSIIESDHLLALDRIYEDTLQALQRAWALSATFLLVTSRQNPRAAHRQVTDLGLGKYLKEIIVVDAAKRMTKATVSRDLGLEAVIGDTEVDLEWAQDLGVPFYASCFGFRSRQFWDNRGVTSYDCLSVIFQQLKSSASE